jgi:lipopolysaccharide export system permease protein
MGQKAHAGNKLKYAYGFKMKALDRYILKLWFAPFIGFFLVVNIVLLFGRLLRAIQAFGDNPIDGMILAEMLFAILPYFLTLTVPFAFFFALLKVLAYLQENSETDALLAAGISPLRVLRPMFALAILFWVFLTWTAMEWMPAGQRAFSTLYQAVQKTVAIPNFTPGQFTQGFEGLTIYHAGEDDKGNMQRFMLEDKRVSPAAIYLAKQAHISRGNELMLLDMYNGVHLEGEGTNLRATYFDKFSLAVDVGGLGVIEAMPLQNQGPTFLDASELLKRYQQKPSQALQAEWQWRWLLPLCL